MKKFIIGIVIIIIAALGLFLYYEEGTLPVAKSNPQSRIFVVAKGESLSEIAKHLSNEGLIRNKIIFYLVVKQLGIDKTIEAGDFRLSSSMNVYQIAKALTHGTLDLWVTIIEGMRKEEVAQLISQNLNIPEVEFDKEAVEGYLFPDTYLFPREATSGAVIKILTDNFNKRLDESLKAQAKQNGLTVNEVLILGSLVEKEARFEADRQQVASILLKRYRND